MVNKKAQAQIITTVLIILLVLAAIIIIWQVVGGTVREGAEEIESQSSCLGLRIDITNVVKGTPLEGTNPLVPGNITIRPTKNISGYQIYLDGTDLNPKDCKQVNNLEICSRVFLLLSQPFCNF